MFLRGVSGDSGNDADADSRIVLADKGGNTGNNVGSYQGDAIRNITGSHGSGEKYDDVSTTGAFYKQSWTNRTAGDGTNNPHAYGFDASRVVPVGSDNRPKNVYVTYIIKY